MKRSRHPVHRTRGYLLLDVVFGLVLMMAVTGLISAVAMRQRHTLQQLAEQRAAVRLAETALLHLRAGETVPAPEDGATIRIEPLDDRPGAPAGWRWVTARSTYGRGSAELIGLTPEGAR